MASQPDPLTPSDGGLWPSLIRMNGPVVVTTIGVVAIAAASLIGVVAIFYEAGSSTEMKLWHVAGIVTAVALAALSYVPILRAQTPGASSMFGIVPAAVVFDSVCFIVGGLIIISFANPRDPGQWAATIAWALAGLAIGALAGFLFGIPRSRREGTRKPAPLRQAPAGDGAATVNAAAGAGQQDASSNADAAGYDPSPIEQISEWLTKIIVGLGLVNLRELPDQLSRWSKFIARSIGSSPDQGASFALAFTIYFVILGFMSNYILTQIFLLKLVNRTSSMGDGNS